jgi:uncharacterized protein YPO0396
LTRIRLVNWHLFENTTITCNGTTYFIGVNGAGKSTILDAVQFALIGGQRDVKFNKAAVSEGKRSLASYVRGELGIEAQRYLRGDATGVVALEFRNPDDTYQVHGAVIDAYEDGRSPEVAYFIVHSAALSDDWFFKSAGEIFDARAFKRHLEHFTLPRGAKAQIFTRVEDYRFHLLNRLGQLKESFTAKIVKGLAFTPLTDIRRFVLDYLLDENLVDVKTLQAQLETLRHFEGLAADIRERIAALDRIDELDGERAANRRRRVTNGYIRRRAQAEAYLAELQDRRLELDQARLELNRARLQRDQLGEQIKRTHHSLMEAQVVLQTDTAAARERELRGKISSLDAELKDLRQRETLINESLAREVTDARRLCVLLAADSHPVSESLAKFVEETSGANLQSLISDLESLGHDFATQWALLEEQVRRLREEGERIEGEIRGLRAGDREASYEAEAPEASRLRRLLSAELGLGADEVIFLCTALHVPDESWQDAVEGVLGANRFTLLVPPSRYDAALRLYRERRQRDNLHGVGVIDTDRITQHGPRNTPADSLAAGVSTDHSAARAFVDLVLGG